MGPKSAQPEIMQKRQPSSCRIYRTEKDLHLDPSCFAPHYSSLCKGRLEILSLAGTCFFYLGSCYDA